MHPLLAAAAVRIDVANVPAVDGFDLATQGDRVVVLGCARALFEAAAGLRGVARGQMTTVGRPPVDAVRARELAGAPFDPPLPPRWSVGEYVTWSARLAGHDRASARATTAEALAAMELTELARSRLGGVPLAARRGTVLAAALATGARALLVDDPLAGLVDEAASAFARVVVRALEGRRWILFAGRLALESPIACAADEAIVLDGARVVARGAPSALAAERTTLALKVGGTTEQVTAYASAIESSGGKAGVAARSLGLTHLRVELGPLTTKDLFRLAVASQATLLELRPFALPLS